MPHDSMFFIFRIINFSALIGLMVYLFKKMGLPAFRTAIHRESVERQGVVQAIDAAQLRERELIEEIRQQALKGDELRQKILMWRRTVANQREARRAEWDKRQEAMNAQQIIKAEYQAIGELRTQMVPEIVKEVRKRADDYFQDEVQQRTFVQTLINRMQESV